MHSSFPRTGGGCIFSLHSPPPATSKTEARTTHSESVSFIVCGHWIILTGISHQTQNPARGLQTVYYSVLYLVGMVEDSCQFFYWHIQVEICKEGGEDQEIYCCCSEQNCWEPLQSCVFSVTIHSITFNRNFILCTKKETGNTFLWGFYSNMCTVNRALYSSCSSYNLLHWASDNTRILTTFYKLLNQHYITFSLSETWNWDQKIISWSSQYLMY